MEQQHQSNLENSNITNTVNNSSSKSPDGEVSASITSGDDASITREPGHALIEHKGLSASQHSVQNLIPISPSPISPPPLPVRTIQRKGKANRSVVRSLESEMSEMYTQENKENIGKVNGNGNIKLNKDNENLDTSLKDKFSPAVYRSLPRMRNTKDEEEDELWENRQFEGVDYIRMHIAKYFTKKPGSKERSRSMYVKHGDLDLGNKGDLDLGNRIDLDLKKRSRSLSARQSDLDIENKIDLDLKNRSRGLSARQGDLEPRIVPQGDNTSGYVKKANIEVVKTKQEVVERKMEVLAGRVETPAVEGISPIGQRIVENNEDTVRKSSPKYLAKGSTVEQLERQLETGYTQQGMGEKKAMSQQKVGNSKIEQQGKMPTNNEEISSNVTVGKELDLIEPPFNMEVHQARPFKQASDKPNPEAMNAIYHDHHQSSKVKHREMPNKKSLKSPNSKTSLTVPKKFTSKYSTKAMDDKSVLNMENNQMKDDIIDKSILRRPAGSIKTDRQQKAPLTSPSIDSSGSLRGSSSSVKFQRREKGALTSLPVVGMAQSEPDMSKRRESLEAIKDHLRKQRYNFSVIVVSSCISSIFSKFTLRSRDEISPQKVILIDRYMNYKISFPINILLFIYIYLLKISQRSILYWWDGG